MSKSRLMQHRAEERYRNARRHKAGALKGYALCIGWNVMSAEAAPNRVNLCFASTHPARSSLSVQRTHTSRADQLSVVQPT
eukprot:3416778-Pleurochrysis_carterae.AAC.2